MHKTVTSCMTTFNFNTNVKQVYSRCACLTCKCHSEYMPLFDEISVLISKRSRTEQRKTHTHSNVHFTELHLLLFYSGICTYVTILEGLSRINFKLTFN